MKPWLKSILLLRDPDSDVEDAVFCAQPGCDRRLQARGAHVGIGVGDRRYCSAECFTLAASGILAAHSAAEVVEVPRTPRLSLGLALLTKGYLTTEQFQHAAAIGESEGVDFESTVMRQGWVTERQLAAARAAQWGYPVLGQDLAGNRVVVDLPPLILRACSAAPLYYSDETKRLVLGFIHRVDHSLLQSIEQIAGCRAEPCFIPRGELARQLDRMAAPARYEQEFVEQPGAVTHMAQKLGGLARDTAATHAAFTRCHSFLWARLSGARKTLDVLFDLRSVEAARGGEYRPEITPAGGSMNERAFSRRYGRQS